MNRLGQVAVVLFLLLALVGCKGDPKKPAVKETNHSDTINDIKFPKEFFEKTDNVGSPTHPKQSSGVAIYLNEVEQEPLGGVQHKVTFGTNGGILDLASIVKAKKSGRYKISFKVIPLKAPDVAANTPPPPEQDPDQVWFISLGKKFVTKGGVEIGAGCNKMLDITKSYLSLKSPGYIVTSSDRADLGALRGIFVLIKKLERVTALSYFEVKDSRISDFDCR